MNFEQNFSPLDTESSEYQSINIVPLVEPVSDELEQEQPKLPSLVQQAQGVRDIKPLPKPKAPKIDLSKLPKVIEGAEKFPIDEVNTIYTSFKYSQDFINGIVKQKLDELPADSVERENLRGYIYRANQANTVDTGSTRTELVYNMMNEFSDIQTNDNTRNSFIRSQYSPAYYSKSKALNEEYNASDLKGILTPRQYSGLKSLSYGKQSDFQDYLKTITDPNATEVDKKLALLILDKIGAGIDLDASAKLVTDVSYGQIKDEKGGIAKDKLVTGMNLYSTSKNDLLSLDEQIRTVEFENPYNLTVTKNIASRAIQRGIAMGASADILNVSSDMTGIDVDRLAEIQRLQQDARASKAFEGFYNNPSLETFSKNPIGILAELTLESLVGMYYHGSTRMAAGAVEGAAVGSVIPGGGTAVGAGYGMMAGMGLTSLNLEISSNILEGISKAGYNISSAEDLRKAFQDEELIKELKKEGYKKGVPVALFDMVSLGLGGKIITKPAKTILGRAAAGAAELGVQATLGAGGEAVGQIVQTGKISKPVDVLMEALGETGPGSVEVAYGTFVENAKNNKAQDKRNLAIVVDGLGLQRANDRIDVLLGSGQINEQQAQQLKDEAKVAFEQMQKMPEMLSVDAKSKIMDLVAKRDDLIKKSEKLDDVFKKEAKDLAEQLNKKILEVANEDISSQQKQKEDATKESSRTQQEGVPEGGLGQYQGTQAIQEQATTEADTGNRPIGSTQEEVAPQFQKVGPITIQWERSPEGKGDPSISARNPIVVEAAKNLKEGKITNEEYRATVSENSPITPITRFFEPATEQEVNNALSKDKVEKVNAPIQDNTVVGLRLDIPAYSNNNTWVVSVHEGATNAGKAVSYRNVARITDVTFGVEPKAAINIAAGVPKTTIGRMFGKWQNMEGATMEEQGENAKKIVKEVVNNPEWVQVGMNPFRHSYFYDRSSQERGRPIKSADEVVQIGGLVYAKNPEYGNWTDESYRVKGMLDAKGVPVQFQTSNVSPNEVADISRQVNQMGDTAVELKVDDAVRASAKADVNNIVTRPQNEVTPQVVNVADFIGKPIMVTISDELTTGDVINPATGNVIKGLMGGIGFNYTQGNTGFAWAYTDEATAQDTLNAAKEIYKRNPQLYPDGIVPVAVVKMGTEAINSNEAVFRVLLDNLNSLPKKNLKNAYSALVKDIKANLDRLSNLSKTKTLSPSERNALNGYKQIYQDYLNKNKSIPDVIKNIAELNINTRPLIMDRITAGEVGLLTDVNRLRADKPVTKALMEGLGKEDIKKIHLGWMTEPLRDPSIKNVPARHVIGFVGIDATAPSIERSAHPNYPFALKGKGLGVVENTVHLASVMPTAYGNAVKKITDAVAGNKKITPAEAVSRAMPSGLANAIFRGKPIVEQESELSKLIGFLNLSFPSVTFFTDQQSFEDIASSPDVKKYVKDGEIIYGLTTDGKIYLNPSIATANTAIHEMGHIWVDYIQNLKPELFNKGISLVEGTPEFEKAKAQLGDNVNARKEALAMLIGNRGESIVNAAQKSKFKEWLVGVWKFLQEQFPALRSLKPEQIESLTLEQFLGGALKDILSGKTISEQKEEYVQIGAAAQKMSDIVPFGSQLPEGPQGPTPPGEVGPVKEPSGLPKRKEYEWESFKKEKAPEGEEMIKTSTGRFVATESMRGQIMDRERTLKEIKKATPSLLSRVMNSIRVGMIDNQANVIKLLESVGRAGELVKSYLLTRNSASTTAMAMAEDAVKNIFGGLSRSKMYTFGDTKISEYVLFNQLIGYQRVISIQKQMDETYKLMVQAYENIVEAPSNSDRTQYIKEYNKHKNRLIENGMLDEGGNYVGETLETEFALGQVTATQAYNLLQEVRTTIGEDDFAQLMTRSQAYSQYFNSMMKSRMEAGLISQDTYNYLSKFFYAPTRYISSVLADPILSMARPTTSYATDRTLKIKQLKGGSERLNASDYEGLLKATIYASEYSIAENRATNRFYNLIDENKDSFEQAGIRLGTKYVLVEGTNEIPVEDAIDLNMKAITEGKKPDGAKALPSGQKQLPYKGIEKANNSVVKAEGTTQIQKASSGPQTVDAEVVVDEDGNRFYAVQVPLKEGEEYIKTYFNGQRKDIIVPKWFAEAWNNDNLKSSTTLTWVGKLTGANLLRVIATGINPVFGVAQLIPDTISAYAATVGERKYLPLLIDYPVFFTKTLAASRDIMGKSSDYLEANKYGATTNFYNGGSVEFERGLLGKEDKSLEKIIEEWNIPGLKQYILGSKKITETTEQMTKVALYKSIRDGKIAEYKKNFGTEPTGQELEDLRIEAGALARSTADFHRKGTLGSDLNKVIPYLNAAIQVQRAVLGSAKQNKSKTLFYTMEFAAYTTLLILSAIGMGDDDDTKEKKRLAYSKWSDFDKENRAPIFFVESQGRFISIKLPEFLVPINTLVSKIIQRGVLEKNLEYTDENFSKDMKDVAMNVMEEFPVTQFTNLEKVASRNPMYSGMSKFFFNRDPYRQEEVVAFEKNTKDYLEGARVGERRAADIYQKIGKGAMSPILPEGISPKRLEAAVNSIPFENNPFSGVLIYATELATDEKKLFEERYGKGALQQILKASGISQRYFKEGSKVNQGIIDNSINEIKDRSEFKDTLALSIMPKFDSLATTMTRLEAYLKIKGDFIKGQYQTLDPEQQKIARTWFDGEFRQIAQKDVQDPMIGQILGMSTSDAKLDAINETLQTIKQTDSSKVEFLRTLFNKGLMRVGDIGTRLHQRGMRTKRDGSINPYFEPEMGYIRDELLKIVEEKRAKQ
jgi:hypothetical protein